MTRASLLFLMASACATTEPTSLVDATSPTEDQPPANCTFDGKSAADYYQQYAYGVVGQELGLPLLRMGIASFQALGALPNGDHAELTAFFLAQDRVILDYNELRVLDGPPGEDPTFNAINITKIVTRSSIDPATCRITIAGVGTGVPVISTAFNGTKLESIDFTYSSDQRSPGLTGQHTVIEPGETQTPVVDPDHLDDLGADDRQRFEDALAQNTLLVIRK